MDDQLKQRLLGATVLVALAVIFVPMLFDEKDADRGSITSTNVPSLPPELQEREIPLPAAPDEGKAEKENVTSGETQERPGYRIIPLDDVPPAAQKPASAVSPEVESGSEKPAAEMPAEFGADEGGEPDQLPTRDSPLAKAARSPSARQGSPLSQGEGTSSRPSAIVVPDRRNAEQAERSRSAGARTAAPRTAESNQPARKGAAAEPPRSEAGSRTKPPVPAAASTPAQRSPPPVKPAEKSAAAAKQSQDKPAETKRTAPLVVPKPSSASAAKRTTTADTVAAKPAAAPKAAGTPLPASRASPEPATQRSAETKTEKPQSGTAKPATPPPDKAAAVKPPPPKSTETAGKKTQDKAADVAAKKKPNTAASTAVASASSSGANTAPKSGSTGAPKAPVPKNPEPPSKPKQSASPAAWVIRAGSFTSESGAKALAEKLKKQQFAAYVQKVSGDSGTIYRVQVGPELEKSRAEQTQKRLESSAGIRGILVSHR